MPAQKRLVVYKRVKTYFQKDWEAKKKKKTKNLGWRRHAGKCEKILGLPVTLRMLLSPPGAAIAGG